MRNLTKSSTGESTQLDRTLTLSLTVLSLFLGIFFLNQIPASAEATCTYPNFAGCDLQGQDFSDLTLTNANFAGANLTGVNFSLTSLTGANLSDANLTGANLSTSDLNGATLTGSTLLNAHLFNVASGSIKGIPASLPTEWNLVAGYLVGPEANLTKAELQDQNLSGLNLTNAVFSDAKLANTNFSQATLRSSNFSKADLSEANLTGANFLRANLTGTNLANVILADTSLLNSNLSSASSGGITGTPKVLPPGWNLSGGYLVGPSANLVRAEFQDQNLSGLNFSSANLTGANLTGANLTSATLTTANFSRANLTRANLSGADLREVTMTAANVFGANITDAKLPSVRSISSGNLVGTPASLSGEDFIYRGYWMGVGSNLEGADLTGFNLINKNFTSATFSGANLTNTNLSGANLMGARFDGANLTSTNLNTAYLSGASGSKLIGTPRNMSRDWKIIGGFLFGEYTNLSNADLHGLDLRSTKLNSANLSSANLSRADLRGSNLSGANLTGSNFDFANLVGQTLNSNLTSASFVGADLTGSAFNSSYLKDAVFTQAVLLGVQSDGKLRGIPAAMPLGWQMLDGYLVGPGAYLRDANLSQMDFSDISLVGATLSGVNLDAAALGETNLSGIKASGITGVPASMPSGWTITKGYLIGPTANLDSANLSGVSLATLDLSGATLTNVSSGNISGVPATLPPEWKIVNGYLVGPGANLSDANLSNANISDANLTGANLSRANLTRANISGGNLSGANLSDANLSNANVYSANLTRANLTGANLDFLRSGDLQGEPSTLGTSFKIIGGYLVGPRVDLSNALLANLDLSSIDLIGTNFRGADLRGANLSASKLWTTVFTSALVDGANFDGAIPLAQATADELKLLLSPEKWSVTSEKISRKIEFKILLDGAPRVGKKVTLAFLAKDTQASYQFQWWREDGTSLSIGTTFYTPTVADLDQKIFCRVTANKANYADTQIDTSLAQVTPGVLTKTVPLISGTARIGGTLSAPSAAWIAGATINYQWFADGKAITSAITPSYKLVASQLNKKITVAVTQSALGYITATATSNAVTVAAGTLTTARPTISGTVKAGNVINAKSTPWITGATLTYQWLLDGKAISGATSASYKVSASQKGKQISVTVTQRATGYATASSTSLSVKVG